MGFITEFVKDDQILEQMIGERLKELDANEAQMIKSGQLDVAFADTVDDNELVEELMEGTRNLALDDGPPRVIYNPFTTELQESIFDSRKKFEKDVLFEESTPVGIIGYTIVLNDVQYQQTLLDLFEQKFAIHSMLFYDIVPLLRSVNYNLVDDPSMKLLLHVIFGVSSNFSSHTHAKIHESYFIAMARDSLMNVVCKCKTNVFIVASIHLLSCYEMGQGELFQSYLLDSMACSISQHMGLHISYDDTEDQEGVYAPKQTPFNAAALWSICTQDRLITNVINVPSVIHFKRIVAPFYQISTDPLDTKHFQELTFAYISRLWYIYDRFTDQIFSVNFDVGETNNRQKVLNTAIKTFKELYASLPLQLRINSPDMLQLSDPNHLLVLLFHFNYYMVNMQLKKIFIREATPELKRSIFKNAARCGELIHQIILQKDVLDVDLLPYYFSHYVGVVALVFLFILTTHAYDQEGSAFYMYYMNCKQMLNMMSINWKLAQTSLENLQNLESKHNLHSPKSKCDSFEAPSVLASDSTSPNLTPKSMPKNTQDFLAATEDLFTDWFQEFPDFQEIKQRYHEQKQQEQSGTENPSLSQSQYSQNTRPSQKYRLEAPSFNPMQYGFQTETIPYPLINVLSTIELQQPIISIPECTVDPAIGGPSGQVNEPSVIDQGGSVNSMEGGDFQQQIDDLLFGNITPGISSGVEVPIDFENSSSP
jgi:hypothetical protein